MRKSNGNKNYSTEKIDKDVIDNCQKFWNFFSGNERSLLLYSFDNNDVKGLSSYGKLLSIAAEVHAEIYVEIDRDDDVSILTITSFGNVDAFPYIDTLWSLREHSDQWIIHKYKQPFECVDDIEFEIDGLVVKFAEIKFTVIQDNQDDSAIVFLFIPGYDRCDERYETVKWLVLVSCLGEYDLTMKVGSCVVYPLEGHSCLPIKPINKLRSYIDLYWETLRKTGFH